MESLLEQINDFKYNELENIFNNKYFKENIFDIEKLDKDTLDFLDKLKIFVQKVDKYNKNDNYPLHKKTKIFIRFLYFIYKYLKNKRILINNQKELKHIILHLALVYKYLKKYNKINFLKNIIKVDPRSESFIKSINIINIKDLYNAFFTEDINLEEQNTKNSNKDIDNIIPLVDDTLKSIENKDSYISNIIKYKESSNLENSLVEYKINKKNILNKINSNKKHK